MADQRRAGLLQLQINGTVQDCKGDFTYSFGIPKRDAIIGSDRPHGYKETPTVPHLEGAITDRGTLDVAALVNGKDLTITLSLANGKVFVLRDAWYAGDGTVNTGEGEIAVRWEGANAEEIS